MDGFRLLAWLFYRANAGKDAPKLGPDDFLKRDGEPALDEATDHDAFVEAFTKTFKYQTSTNL